MNKIIFFLLLVVMIPVLTQEETLMSGEVESGGFDGPVLKMRISTAKMQYWLAVEVAGLLIIHSFLAAAVMVWRQM